MFTSFALVFEVVHQIERNLPPSTAKETPRIPPEAGIARNAIADAVSRGEIKRPIGTWTIQPS